MTTVKDHHPPERARLGAPLTARETAILTMYAGGATDGEVAREMFLSVRTVRRYALAAGVKLGARTRVHAVVLAVKAGLVAVEDAAPSGGDSE